MNRKIAIIDCGTNTFHLLITWVHGDGIPLVHIRRTVRIGQGGIEKKVLLPEAQERAMAVLREYAGLINDHEVFEVRAFATSAFRSASNGVAFRDRILQETGLMINIINGEEEAEWIYKGVRDAIPMGQKVSLIMDIGGGSCEFIMATDDRMIWKQSFEIGAQRLLDRFMHTDPISSDGVRQLYDYLSGELQPLLAAAREHQPVVLIGASGTFDTLSCIFQLANGMTPELRSPELPLTVAGFNTIHGQLLTKDQNQRMAMPGMIEMRVDMIVVASCLVDFVLRELSIRHIRVSRYALKEGVLADLRREAEL